jgi:hypothetical protein
MASGDAQRTWFPEMIEMLKDAWHPDLSPEELIALRDRLDKTLQTIRRDRNIVPPMMWCSKCQKRHRSAHPKVSVRATVLAVGRFQIADQSEVKSLEKKWNTFRKQNQLDLYGNEEADHNQTLERARAITSGCEKKPF